jgi:hypothetical protein
MQISEQDGKELQRIADQIDAITQRVRAFRERHSNLDGVQVSSEYMTLLTMFNRLKKELDSIP